MAHVYSIVNFVISHVLKSPQKELDMTFGAIEDFSDQIVLQREGAMTKELRWDRLVLFIVQYLNSHHAYKVF